MIETIKGIVDIFNSIVGDNQFAQGGIMIALASWIFYQLKSVPMTIYSYVKKLFIYELTINVSRDDDTYQIFSDWYGLNFPKKYRKAVLKIDTIYDDENDNIKTLEAKLYQNSDVNIIWYAGRLLFVEKIRSKLEHATHIDETYTDEYIISGMFAKQSIHKLIHSVIQYKQKEIEAETGILLRLPNVFGTKSIKIFKTFDKLFFEGKDKLIKYLDNWSIRRDLSHDMGINHKTGITLHGPPGTGKTSIAKAISHRYKMDLVMVPLGSFKDDQSLIEYVSNLSSSSVLLFEDVDDYLGKTTRSKLKSESKISFSTILQILDGVISPNNAIIIFTTNHMEELDPSLYRDGRINYRLYVGYPSKDDIIKFIECYYRQSVPGDIHIPNEITMATVEQIVMRVATIDECIIELKHA